MTSVEAYRAALRALDDWDPYLLAESGLPGPRSNLELVQAAAELGSADRIRCWLAADSPDTAPENTPAVFLTVCGTVGLGRLLAEGDSATLDELRALANDPRWRVREAVCMALQRWGDSDMDALLAAMDIWAGGSRYEQRAAAAALCEPRLLSEVAHAARTLALLDRLTAGLINAADRRSEPFRTLRQALGYCWSVALVANPVAGRPLFEQWSRSPDADARWVVRKNLKKNRLERLDAAWVASLRAQMNQCALTDRW